MLCEEIMKRDVECLLAQDTAQEAAKKMRDTNVGFLPVCDPGGKVVGTLTDRDLALRLVAENRSSTVVAAEIMTREVVACRPSDDIAKAEQVMGQKHKSRILCIDEQGKLRGVISLSDIAQHEDAARVGQTVKQVTERETRVH